MKLITDLGELKGKIISGAVSVDIGELLAIVFSDKTYMVIGIESYGESHDTVLIDNVSDVVKRDAGVISEAEYDAIVQARISEAQKIREASERKQLEELKAKYPEVISELASPNVAEDIIASSLRAIRAPTDFPV